MPNKQKHTEHPKVGDMNGGSQTVLAPESSITHENCHELEESINDAVKQNKTEIILDCKSVPFLDSIALELMVKIHDEMSNKRGALKIVGLNAVCRDILKATRIINLLNVYDDIHKAITGRP